MDTNLGRVIGYDGKQIELSRDSLYIKWRYVGDTVWKNLIALNDLKVGLPKGGKTNQVLAKLSNKDWDYVWKTPEGGGGSIDTIELASITTAPLAPFPINTKYYNANDNIIYKAIEENTWENADTEEPVLGAFYIYDDEIYFYDKKFQSLYMVKQTPYEGQSTAYITLNKVKNYLYQTTFANIDYDFANDYFKTRKPNVVLGGCSTVRNGNFIGRNYDWFYSEDVSFVVNTPRINGKYASVSVSSSIPGLTQEYMTAGDYDQSLFKLVPFFALDGVNEYGVSVSDLVVHIEEDYGITTETEPDIQKRDEVCALMLPRYILDNFKSAQEAVEYIRDYVSVYTLESLKNVGYELHFMISDNIKSYCLEFINNKVEVTNIASTNPYMTNFYLHNITTIDSPIAGIPQGGVYTPATVSQGYLPTSLGIKSLGDGLERWNLIVSNYASTNTKNGMQALMANTLKYTKSYLTTTNPQWNTEFVGDWDFDFEGQHYTISLTVDSPESDYEIVKEYVRTYYERGIRDSKTWHTEHSSIYDLKEKKLYLIVQEDGQELEFGLNYYTREEIKNNLIWEKGTGLNSVQTIQSEVNKNNAAGDSSVSEGAATDAHSFASHAEGYMTSTGTSADYSHAEGYKTSTQGVASHAEGDSTVTNNPAEHAEGKYNKSNMGGTDATNTLSSIGIGNASGSIPGGERKNAVEVMQNGDMYIKNVGGYDGTNPIEADTLQEVIANKADSSELPIVNNSIITIQKNNIDIDNFTLNQNTNKSINIEVPIVVDNVTTTDTNKSLSANMGKELQDQITNLKSRGRYLSIWNCTTGLAQTEPTVNPYEYRTGDYFIVGVIGTTNYRPDGSQYDKDVPSTTVETNDVKVNDTYYYDGTDWTLLDIGQVASTFSSLGGSPYDNSNLEAALLSKEDVSNRTNDYTANEVNTYPSSYALAKAIATVKPNEVTNSGNSLPSVEGYALNDTFLNTNDKKLYTVISDNYILQNYNISIALPDFDSTNAILSGFMPRLTSMGSTTQEGKYLISTAEYALRKLWYDVLTIRFHFQLSELKNDGKYYNIYSFSNSEIGPNAYGWTLQLKDGELFWAKIAYGSYAVTGAIKLTDYKFDSITKHYYVEINKIDSTYANTKISNVGYDQELVADDTVECPDYISIWYSRYGLDIGYISSYEGIEKGVISPIKLYLLDSYGGNYLVRASGTNNWDQGYALTNLSQYADITNGIMYSYINNELYSNVAEFDKIQGSPYDNSALADVLDSKADIGDIKNSTITINQGGVFKGEFTLNQSENATINLDAGGEGGSYPIHERVITEEDFQNYKVSYKGNVDDEYLDIISLINDEQINGNINLNNYRCFIDGANLSNRFIIFKNGEILLDSMEGGCGKALELNNAFIIFDDTTIIAPQLEDSSTAAIELNTNSNLTFKNLNIEAMFSNDKSFVKFNDENSRLELENITSNIICNEDLSGEDANFEFGFIYVDENNNSVSFKNCNRIRIANDQADDDAEIQCYFIRTAQNKTIRIEGYNSTIVMHGRGNGQVFDVNLDNENIEVSSNDFQGSLTARFETSEETINDILNELNGRKYTPTPSVEIKIGEYWDISEWDGEPYALRIRVNDEFTVKSMEEYIELMPQYVETITKSIYSFNNNSFRRTDGYGYLFTSNANAIAAREIVFEDGGFRVKGLFEAQDGQALVYKNGEFRPEFIGGGNDDGYMHPRNNDEFMEIINNRNNAAISFDQFDYSTIPSQGYQISDKDYFEFKDLDLSTGRDDFDFDILNQRLFYFENSGIKFKNLNINIDDKEVSGYNPVIEFGGNDNYKELHIEDSNININNVLYQDNNYSFRVIYVDSKRFSMKNSSVYVRAQDDSTKGQFLIMHTSDYLYFDAGLISLNIENSNINVNNFDDFTAAIVYEGPGVKNADSSLRLNIDKSSINAWCNDFNNSVNIKLINYANDININYSQVGKLDVVKLNDWDFQDWEEDNTYNQNDKIKWTAPWDENFKKYLLVKNGFTAGDPDSIWQEYDNGNIEDYYQVDINGTLYSAFDPENLIHFNGNGTNIYTDGVNTRFLNVEENNWNLPFEDENVEARDLYSAVRELAGRSGSALPKAKLWDEFTFVTEDEEPNSVNPELINVDMDQYLSRFNGDNEYRVFVYNGQEWECDGDVEELSDIGITIDDSVELVESSHFIVISSCLRGKQEYMLFEFGQPFDNFTNVFLNGILQFEDRDYHREEVEGINNKIVFHDYTLKANDTIGVI